MAAFFIGFAYYELAIGYLNTGRDLRRMESNTRSPIFLDFGEILEGIVTVRAISAEKRFLNNVFVKIDTTTKVGFFFCWHFRAITNLLPYRCGIVSGWRTVGFFWTSMPWGLCLSKLRRWFLYLLWRMEPVLRVYASWVQWDLQLQVNANWILAFSLINKWHSSILGLPILDK